MSLPRNWLANLLAVLLLSAAPLFAQTAEPPQPAEGPMAAPAPSMAKILNNGSIMRMVGAGLSDDLVLQAITSQPGQYTTDADSLVELKKAGVSERVISAMMNKGRKRLTPEGNTAEDPPPAPISEVSEIGAYYKDRKGAWQPLETEVVHIKSGGWLKSTATHGIIREDRNGHLKGRESKLALQAPIEILIYAPIGVDIAEYDFLRFRINSDNREFRVMTGGVFHSSSGADRDEVEFHATKAGQHAWRFTIDRNVGGGEFGILPPFFFNDTATTEIYTFAITE